MQRRRLLTLGLTSTAVLMVAGGAAMWVQPGLQSDATLSRAGREVFSAIGRGVLDKSLPQQEAARQTAVDGLIYRIDSLVQALPPHAQAELSQLLSVLASAPGRRTIAGLSAPWPQASVADVQEALQSMRLSALALRQQAYGALHDIVMGAYFVDAATWPLLGYPGPLKI